MQIRKNYKKFYIYLLLFILIFSFISNKPAIADNDAGTRASFTRGGWVGARYVAMGKAAEVITDDVYSIYWNPAGLRELREKESISGEEIRRRAEKGDIEGITEKDLTRFSEDEYQKTFVQVGVSAAVLDEDRQAGFAGVAFSLYQGVMGIGFYGIQSRGIETYNTSGTSTGKSNYLSSIGFISYGWGMGVASVGVSLKTLYEKIASYGFYGFGSDIGTQIELIPLFKIGFVIQDIGTGLKPADDYDNIKNKYEFASPVFKLSASLTNRESDFIVAMSVIKKIEQSKFEFNFGFQYNVFKYASLYLGLNNSRFSTGVSLKVYNADLTYAFSVDKINYGYNNTLSLTLVI